LKRLIFGRSYNLRIERELKRKSFNVVSIRLYLPVQEGVDCRGLCSVIKCTTDLIRIQLPGTQYHGKHMDFKRADDGLFYMEVIPVPDTAEQANSNRVIDNSDDDSDNDLNDSDDSDDSDDDDDDHDHDHYEHDQEYYGQKYYCNSDTEDEDDGPKDGSNKPGSKRLESIDMISIVHTNCAIIRENRSCKKWQVHFIGSSLVL
jgi:hypothetical protein